MCGITVPLAAISGCRGAMRHKKTSLELLFLIIIMAQWFALCGYAQADSGFVQKEKPAMVQEPENSGWSIYMDNDIFTPRPRDQDYTGSLSVTFSGYRTTAWFFSADSLMGAINNVVGLAAENHANGIFHLHGLQLGAAAFTPGDISIAEVTPGDRPYVGLIYSANSRLILNEKNQDTVQLTTLTLGVLGTSLLPGVQKGFHKAVDSDGPMGWSHQISAGGEPTVSYSYALQHLWGSGEVESSRFEIKSSAEAAAGFITGASVAVSARWGRITTPWWSFSSDRSEYFSQPATGFSRDQIDGDGEWYVWAGTKLKVRAYNVFLQGQFRDSDLTYGANDVRPVIAEAWIGVTGQVSHDYWLSWEMRYQTSELRVEPGDRPMVWGRIYIARYF